MRQRFPGRLVSLVGLLLVIFCSCLGHSLASLLQRQSVEVSALFSSSVLNVSGCPCSLPYGDLQAIVIQDASQQVATGANWTLLGDGSLLYEPIPLRNTSETATTLLEAANFSGSLVLDANNTALAQWSDYTATVAVNASFGDGAAGLLVRVRDTSDFYLLRWSSDELMLSFERVRPGFLRSILATANATTAASVIQSGTVTLTITAVGREFQASLNNWNPWGVLTDSAGDATLDGSTGLFASGDGWLSFGNWTVDGAVQIAATPVPAEQMMGPVPSPVGVPAQITPLNDTSGIRLAYTLYFPIMNISEFTSAMDVVIRSALDTRLGFQTTWLVGKRPGSVYADYYSLVPNSSPYAQENGTALASDQLRSYVCNGGLTFDTGVNATCPNDTIAVTRIVPPPLSKSSGGSAAGLVSGVVVSIVLSLVALAGILLYVYRRHRSQKLSKERRMQLENDEEREQAKSSALSITALSSACGMAVLEESSPRSQQHPRSDGTVGMRFESPPKRCTNSVREALRAHLLASMLGHHRPKHGRWDTLVLDARCAQILSAVCRFSELAAHGINAVESLEQVLQLKHFSARTNTIFLITGDDVSLAHVAQVCASLSPRASSPSKASMSQRRSDTLLLTIRPMTSPLLDMIRGSLCSAQANLYVQELCADVLAIDDYAFSLELPEVFGIFYGRNAAPTSTLPQRNEIASSLKRECTRVGVQLAACLRILGLGMPKIEIHTTHVASNVAMGIADAVRSVLDEDGTLTTVLAAAPAAERAQNSARVRPPNSSQRHRNIRLLLIDRAADPITPIRHDLAYDAFVHDVLASVDDATNSGLAAKPHRKLLTAGSSVGSSPSYGTADDPTWLRLRYLRIHEAVASAHAELDRFLAGSATACSLADHEAGVAPHSRAARRGPVDASSDEAAVAAYHQVVERLSFHLEQLEKCTALFQSRSIATIMDVESMLVSGRDANTGRRVRRADQQQRIETLLNHPSVEPSAKLRLLLLWVACRGADANLLVRWIAKAQIDDRGRCALRAFIECLRAERHSTEAIKRLWRARDGAPLLVEILSRCASTATSADSVQAATGAATVSAPPTALRSTARRLVETRQSPSSRTRQTRTPGVDAFISEDGVSDSSALRGIDLDIDAAASLRSSARNASHAALPEAVDTVSSCTATASAMHRANSGISRNSERRNMSAASTNSSSASAVVVVFFIGGLSHTECRLADTFARQMPNIDIYIGGTHLTSPNAFLRDLAGLFHETKEEA
ncbi:syntaxin binding protein [Cyanidiococcus yangmingshanensis]|uniref:Syntaxin binding protein n=1 Tax=Cyanidiococcus yangmingshanensis TaxID=2690220 RepID=A0A7J7IJ86_9RHOD|nr:syntaxin binding protein [Cyanidiococcus yangmingshanensis]